MATWAEAPLLVPLDGRDDSLRAIPIAGRIARRLGNELQLVGIVSKQNEVEARGVWLHEVAAQHLGDEAFTAAVAVADDVAAEIANIAEPGNLICMATAGSVRFHAGHWGSVAEAVAREVARPMLMVGPNVDTAPGQATQRVVAPMDSSPHAEAAAVPAAELAAALGVPLWLVEVASPMDQASQAAHHSGVVTPTEEKYVTALVERLGRVADVEIHHEVLQSENPATAIVDFVGDDGTAVMSTHGRSGLGRLFAGSVSAGVVAHSSRAVVVIRPDQARYEGAEQ